MRPAPGILNLETRPRLADFVWLRHDPARARPVLLSPESVSFPDDIAAEILARCTGRETVADIAAALATRYEAEPGEIAADVIALLAPLAAARLLDEAGAERALPPPRAVATSAGDPGWAADSGTMPPPVGLLMELTHRCPLQCVYCSNPIELDHRSAELETGAWQSLLGEAAALGVLQVHLSGGEPTLRPDLADIIETASDLGLYANLITAGVNLGADRIAEFRHAGLPHVQLSIQAADEATSRTISGFRDALAPKRRTAEAVRAAGMALTVNAPVHRLNLDGLDAIIDFATAVDAHRLEIAHVQYYGWAARNRASLAPTAEQVRRSIALVEDARRALAGRLAIDFVAPDQHATYPKPCMGGWARKFINVTPAGLALPCHAAQTIEGLAFENVRDRPLAWIWASSPAFNAYRGTAWMQEPCASCARRERDWGGCRCQAFAVLGDAGATDPACALSPHQARFRAGAAPAVATAPEGLVYRRPAPVRRLPPQTG